MLRKLQKKSDLIRRRPSVEIDVQAERLTFNASASLASLERYFATLAISVEHPPHWTFNRMSKRIRCISVESGINKRKDGI